MKLFIAFSYLSRKFLATVTAISLLMLSLLAPPLAQAGLGEGEEEEIPCIWTDYFGECVYYDERSFAPDNPDEICVWYSGDSELTCEPSEEEEDEDEFEDKEDDFDEDEFDEDEDEDEWKTFDQETFEDERGGEVDEEWYERELENMEENVKWVEKVQEKELPREVKALERAIKELERELEDLEEEREWFIEDGWDTGPIDEISAKIEAAIGESEALIDEFSNLEVEVAAALSEIEDAFKQVTYDTVGAAWLIIQKGQLVSGELDILRGQSSYHEISKGLLEWEFERVMLENDLNELGITLPEEFQQELEDAEASRDEFFEVYENVLLVSEDLRAVMDSIPEYNFNDVLDYDYQDELWDLYDDYWDARDELMWAQDDMWYVSDDLWEVWDVFEEIWELIEEAYNEEWIFEDLQWIREDIGRVEAAFEILEDKIENTLILRDIEEVLSLVDEAYTMLDQMEAMAEEGADPEDMEELGEDLEKLGDYVDPRIESVAEYFEEHRDELDLSSDEEAIIEDMLSMEEGGEKGDRLSQAYNEDVAEVLQNYVSEDQISDLIAMVTAAVMESLTEYIDAELADQIVQKIMENLEHFKAEKFGSDFTNRLIENGNQVFEQMAAVDLEAIEGVNKGLKNELLDLHEEFKVMAIPEEALAEEAAAFWEDVANTVSASPEDEEVQELVEEGEDLLDEIQESQYENHLALKDVPGYFDEDFEDVWYAESVMEGLGTYWEGTKDKSGQLTYEYVPTNNTLRAEALKMVLSAAGSTEKGSGDQWWSGWENRASEIGLSIVTEDLTQPITRGEVFRLIAEVADMDAETYHGYFPDVTVLDDYAPVEALYEAGLVTGDDITGKARLGDSLNRAEIAVLIQRVVTWQEEQEFLEEDLLSYQDSARGFSLRVFLARLGQFLKEILPASLLD